MHRGCIRLSRRRRPFSRHDPHKMSRNCTLLGLINYYAKFIPNLAAVLHPLHDLLRTSKPWSSSRKCQKAFEEAKQKLTSAPVLAHYDPKLPIQRAGDASPYGVGSRDILHYAQWVRAPCSLCLSHIDSKRAQLCSGGLSYSASGNFTQFLYFTVITDHKLLNAILGPKRGVPPWLLLVCSDGHCYCPPTVMISDFGLLNHTAMPTVSLISHSLTLTLWVTVKTPPSSTWLSWMLFPFRPQMSLLLHAQTPY